jgi:hypothetical protein
MLVARSKAQESNDMSIVNRENLQAHSREHHKQNSWWMNDARGIPLRRVCEDCIRAAKSMYAPEVLGERGNYEDVVEEQIEDDY